MKNVPQNFEYQSTVKFPWGAVIAGAVVSISYEVLLNFLGVGIGLTTFNINEDGSSLGIGAVVWIILSGIISMGAGGWIAGKVSYLRCRFNRAYVGLLSWGCTMIAILFISLSTMGGILGGTGSLANSLGQNSSKVLQSQGISKEDGLNAAAKAGSLLSNNISKEAVQQAIQKTTVSVGVVSLILFAGFLLSAIAGILGAMYSYKETQPNVGEQTPSGSR